MAALQLCAPPTAPEVLGGRREAAAPPAGPRGPYHCLVMSNIMTTPLQFWYTSRNSASRASSDSAWGGEGIGREGRRVRRGPTAEDRHLEKAEQDFYNLKRQ